jgi:VanZ family protein
MNALRHWWPAMAWAGAIFLFSTGYFGGEHTSRFILPFLRWLLPDASPETLTQLHFLVRKAGHFGEYFLFSLLVLRGLRGEASGWKWSWGLTALGISAGYAALDEFHQYFVPSRGAAWQDVFLDSAGAIAAQACARLWFGKSVNRE